MKGTDGNYYKWLVYGDGEMNIWFQYEFRFFGEVRYATLGTLLYSPSFFLPQTSNIASDILSPDTLSKTLRSVTGTIIKGMRGDMDAVRRVNQVRSAIFDYLRNVCIHAKPAARDASCLHHCRTVV